jgi:hypothetical protein
LTRRALFAHRPADRQLGDSMLFSHRAAFAAKFLLICAGAASLSIGAASARPLMPAEDRFIPYSGDLPSCDDWWMLNQITWAFNSHEPEFNSSLELQGFQRIGEVGHRTNGPDLIPRRYCAARALFNDGRVREVKYNLIERGGFVGFGTGVEWCVVGLDRNHVYSPACSGVGP